MPFRTIEVIGGTPTATLLADLDEVCTLVNADASNVLTISDVESAQPNDPLNTITLGPGQIMSSDGSGKIYGSAPPNMGLNVIKLIGITQYGGASSQTPSVTSPSIATGTVSGSGSTDLIGGSGNPNPNKLAIRLLSATICPVLFGSSPTAQNWQDQIQDSTGFPYLTAQVGLPSTGGICAPPVTQDMKNAVVPANRKLQLVNGGVASGAVHVTSATVVYYLVSAA